jgi:hypothetical protein
MFAAQTSVVAAASFLSRLLNYHPAESRNSDFDGGFSCL